MEDNNNIPTSVENPDNTNASNLTTNSNVHVYYIEGPIGVVLIVLILGALIIGGFFAVKHGISEFTRPMGTGPMYEGDYQKPAKTPEELAYELEQKVGAARLLTAFSYCGEPLMPLNKNKITLEQLDDSVKGSMVASIGDRSTFEPEDYKKYFDDLSFLYKLKENPYLSYTGRFGKISYKDNRYLTEPINTQCNDIYPGKQLYYIGYETEDTNIVLIYVYYWIGYDAETNTYTLAEDENGTILLKNIRYDKGTQAYINNDTNTIMYKGSLSSTCSKYKFYYDVSTDYPKFVKMTYEKA